MTPTKLFKGLSTCLLRLCGSHLIILWLGLLSCQWVYAETCPMDSIIGRSQDGACTYLEKYLYDDAGHTILEEKWRMNEDSVLIGQSKTTTEYYPNGKVKEIASWTWSEEKNDWIGLTKNEYIYYENGNQKEWNIYEWSTSLDGWANQKKTEYVYNEKNKLILTTTFIGDELVWIPQTKREQDYDNNGKTILDRYWSGYNTSTNLWIGSTWKAWEYKSTTYPNSPSSVEEYTWENNAWSGKTKYDAEYDKSGRIILKINYANYNPLTNLWEYSSKNQYGFDQWGNINLMENYTWNVDYWKGESKVEYEFDANKKQIAKATYAWDDADRKWVGIEKSKTLYDENNNLILDEQYRWSANDWVGTKKEEYTYDANKQVISTITYKWDVVKNTWGYSTKVLADYDSHKNQTKDERYQWATDASLPEGGYWKGTKYEVTTYNDKNVETDKITYQWDDTNRRWLGSSKSNYEFDAANHLVLEEQYAWVLDPSNPAGGYWQGTKKEEFGYNAANQQIKHVTYEWSTAINDWIGKTKVLSDFDSNKNQTLNEQYTWTIDASPEGGYWHGTIKEEYTFNKNKQQTSSLIYTWNDTQRSWDYVSKTKSEYDAKKNLILDERYEWQNGAWVGTLKKEYAYNAQGQQTMFAFYAWDEAKKAFVGTQKEETELDAEGRTILHATYTWGTTDWKGKAKDTYTYMDGDVQASHTTYKWQSNKWVEDKQTEWTYTESGKIATEVVSTWSNNAWVYCTKLENIYTAETLTAYINYKWVNNAWVAATKWEQVNANTERTYEWWNNNWSITQETSKEYDGQNRLVRESDQNYSHGTPTSGSKTEYTYTGDMLTQKSSYILSGDWIETDRITYSFDGENRPTNTTTYTRVGSELQYVSKTDNEYNGKNITTTSYTWTGTEWQGVEKEEKIYSNDLDYTGTKYEWKNGGWSGVSKTGYTYYANGKEKSVIIYRWSGTTWIEDTKTEYEYSGTKNIVTAMYQMENGRWVGQSKVGNYYDEGEDLTTATWTWTNGKWAPNTKLGESHDADGNLTGQTTYSKKGDDFIYNTKTEYEYGATTKDKTTATYKWNTTTNAWQGVSKSGVTYNGSKIASETTYTWISGLTWQPNQKKEYEYGVQAKDLTTAIYQWDATISAWVGVSKSGVTYASNGKIASEFSYTWNGTDWVGVTKTEYEYGDGKNNSVATYKGNGTDWVGVVKTSEVYTATGDSLGFYTYCWKDGAWADSLKTEYTYDERGNTIYYIQAQLVNGVWSNLETSTWWNLQYDAAGNVILDAHYTWNVKKGKWYGDTQLIYEYDSNGNMTFYQKDTWSGTAWKGKSKNVWTYNSANKLINSEVWSWNNTKKKWAGTSKSEYGYVHDTIQNMTALYRWNSSMWDWEGASKSETLYDEDGNQIASCQYSWSQDLWDWVGTFKFETVYDDKKRVIEQITYRYDTDWYYDTKTQYVYDDKHGQIEKKEYTSYNGKLVLTYQTTQTYDDDANGKLRTDLDASWNTTGEVSTYTLTSYYYACDPKFQIVVEANPTEGGEVSGGGEYIMNGQATISVTPDEACYIFKQWVDTAGTVVSTDATYTFLVTKDDTYTAEFTPVERTTSASVKDNVGGSVKVTVE